MTRRQSGDTAPPDVVRAFRKAVATTVKEWRRRLSSPITEIIVRSPSLPHPPSWQSVPIDLLFVVKELDSASVGASKGPARAASGRVS